jgi:hypothetical protein
MMMNQSILEKVKVDRTKLMETTLNLLTILIDKLMIVVAYIRGLQHDGAQVSSRQQAQTRNTLGQEIKTKEEIWEDMFTKPHCACCGSANHGLLTRSRDTTGSKVKSEYCCPATLFNEWEEAKKILPIQMKYRACPRKFVNMCTKEGTAIDVALTNYKLHGIGRCSTPRKMFEFIQKAMNQYDDAISLERLGKKDINL